MNVEMTRRYDIWKYQAYPYAIQQWYPFSLFDPYNRQPYRGYDDLSMMSSARWRHQHSLTWPLRTTSFLSPFKATPFLVPPPFAKPPTVCLFPKLNGRVLSHSCGYSFDQRAWPSFRDIRTVVSGISRDTLDPRLMKEILLFRLSSMKEYLFLYRISLFFKLLQTPFLRCVLPFSCFLERIVITTAE